MLSKASLRRLKRARAQGSHAQNFPSIPHFPVADELPGGSGRDVPMTGQDARERLSRGIFQRGARSGWISRSAGAGEEEAE
jgi:hypothetical protein